MSIIATSEEKFSLSD